MAVRGLASNFSPLRNFNATPNSFRSKGRLLSSPTLRLSHVAAPVLLVAYTDLYLHADLFQIALHADVTHTSPFARCLVGPVHTAT